MPDLLSPTRTPIPAVSTRALFQRKTRIGHSIVPDDHAKRVSANPSATRAFRFLQSPRHTVEQACLNRGACEQRSSLWEECLSPSPGQLGSIQSLNVGRAGDYFSLAGAQGFEPRNGGTKNRCLTTWRRPSSGRGGELVKLGPESNSRIQPCFDAVWAVSSPGELPAKRLFAAPFLALRGLRKAAIGPAPSEYSSAW